MRRHTSPGLRSPPHRGRRLRRATTRQTPRETPDRSPLPFNRTTSRQPPPGHSPAAPVRPHPRRRILDPPPQLYSRRRFAQLQFCTAAELFHPRNLVSAEASRGGILSNGGPVSRARRNPRPNPVAVDLIFGPVDLVLIAAALSARSAGPARRLPRFSAPVVIHAAPCADVRDQLGRGGHVLAVGDQRLDVAEHLVVQRLAGRP